VAYQPIESYGVIGDMRTASLVSSSGSLDWLCFPQFDSPSVFAAVLDDRRGGRFVIAPGGEGYRSKQLYWPDSIVRVTPFLPDSRVAEVTDYMPAGAAAEQSGTGRRVPGRRGARWSPGARAEEGRCVTWDMRTLGAPRLPLVQPHRRGSRLFLQGSRWPSSACLPRPTLGRKLVVPRAARMAGRPGLRARHQPTLCALRLRG
jgi:hypothetical protein